MSKATSTTAPPQDDLLAAANEAVRQVAGGSSLGKFLGRATERRWDTYTRLISALQAGQEHQADTLAAQAQRELGPLREQALAVAVGSTQQEADRLFGVGSANVPITPQDRAQIDHRVEQAMKGVTTEAECLHQLQLALRGGSSLFQFGVAGGIAFAALERGWDEPVAVWCQPGLGGGPGRGGWVSVASLRAHWAVTAALRAGVWPGPLADAPTVADAKAKAGLPVGRVGVAARSSSHPTGSGGVQVGHAGAGVGA
ncbi:hypothetical protein [Cellulomonas sp. P5_C5]